MKLIHKVKVIKEACVSAGTCVVIAPHAFSLNEEEIAVVLEGAEKVDDNLLFKAAQSCPTQAIVLLDEKGNQLFPKLS